MITAMATRRMLRINCDQSPELVRAPGLDRHSRAGMTRSLDTMMARATEATITMAVAADNPPTKVISASQF